MICPACHGNNDDEARFCERGGHALELSSRPVAVGPTPGLACAAAVASLWYHLLSFSNRLAHRRHRRPSPPLSWHWSPYGFPAAPAAQAARHQAPVLPVGTPSNGCRPAAYRASQPLASHPGELGGAGGGAT